VGISTDSRICIYELHADKWIKRDGALPNADALRDELLPYIRQLGCTHVLLSGEHPQGAEYYRFVNAMEANGIGVLTEKPEIYSDFGELVLSYIAVDPYFRKGVHASLVAAVNSCAWDSAVSLSHRQLSKTPVDAAFGSYDEKFANFRLAYTLMMTVPGKKHIFMGAELAPFKVWDGESAPEWFLLDFERHRQARLFTAELCLMCLRNKALGGSLEWLFSDENTNVIAFKRSLGESELVAAFNFSPVDRRELTLGGLCGEYHEIFSSDSAVFGGEGRKNHGVISADESGKSSFVLPGLTAVILEGQNKRF